MPTNTIELTFIDPYGSVAEYAEKLELFRNKKIPLTRSILVVNPVDIEPSKPLSLDAITRNYDVLRTSPARISAEKLRFMSEVLFDLFASYDPETRRGLFIMPTDEALYIRGQRITRRLLLPELAYQEMRVHENIPYYLSHNGVRKIRLPKDPVMNEYDVVVAPIAKFEPTSWSRAKPLSDPYEYYRANVVQCNYRISVPQSEG